MKHTKVQTWVEPPSIRNHFPSLTQDSHQDMRGLVYRHTMPTIERLWKPTKVPVQYDVSKPHDTTRNGKGKDKKNKKNKGGKGKGKGKGKKIKRDIPFNMVNLANTTSQSPDLDAIYLMNENPSAKTLHVAGPQCNHAKCSKISGCGRHCVCHPYGWFGWRCIPKCCLGLPLEKGYPALPCKELYKGYKGNIQCMLPGHTWPGPTGEHYWNPYHTYQGSLEYPKAYGPALSAEY